MDFGAAVALVRCGGRDSLRSRSKLVSHADWAAEGNTRYNPTIAANLASLGINLTSARIVQLCVAAVIVRISSSFRGGVTAMATAMLLVGTFLATPYAYVYDLTILTNAVVVVLAQKSRTEVDHS